MMFAPLANEAHLHEGDTGIGVPAFAESADQADESVLEFRTGVIAGLKIGWPVFLGICGPMQINAGDDLDVGFRDALPPFITKGTDAVDSIGARILEFIPPDIVAGEGGKFVGKGFPAQIRAKSHQGVSEGGRVNRRADDGAGVGVFGG